MAGPSQAWVRSRSAPGDRALISVEDPAHRAITVVSARSSSRVLLASISVAVISCLILTVVGVVLPSLVGAHTVDVADLALGIEAELTGAGAGIAIGLLCSRLVIRRQGYALVAALALVMVALPVRGLPSTASMTGASPSPQARPPRATGRRAGRERKAAVARRRSRSRRASPVAHRDAGGEPASQLPSNRSTQQSTRTQPGRDASQLQPTEVCGVDLIGVAVSGQRPLRLLRCLLQLHRLRRRLFNGIRSPCRPT